MADILKILKTKFMYGEKIQKENYETPTAIYQPELAVIIGKLYSIIDHYDNIVCETKGRLQAIKKYEEPSLVKESMKEKEPESVVEQFNHLLSRLHDLNEKAQENLRHLKEIV
jgi:hypothetical protein